MTYELTFTRGFREGLEGLPREIYPIVDRQLERIQKDPFSKNSNATRMKNVRNTFRVRIGNHVRMLYQVNSQQRRVELNHIGSRENFYEGGIRKTIPMTPEEADAIRKEISGTLRIESRKPSSATRDAPSGRDGDLLVDVEALEWITEEELFLLHVPNQSWRAIIEASTIEGLQASEVDSNIKEQIEDYWTNPLSTQVEKLYALSAGQDAGAIAQQPLSQFLIALDPEQKRALQRIKDDGPYLLKGSAGTGKSLVGLYHIRDLIVARAGASLFDTASSRYGVITYTNTLVDANQSLLKAITPVSAHPGIRCTTLDKIACDLAKRYLGRKPSLLNVDGIAAWISEQIVTTLPETTADFVQRLGAHYVADEIEQVIVGNGLTTVTEYIDQERRGRRRGMRKDERREIWSVYEAFNRRCEENNAKTFGQLRMHALRYLAENPDYPRFAALFVDEAQDFSKVARQLCLSLVRDPRHLVLAADTGQSIFTVPPSWGTTDPRLNFRRRRPIMLEQSYRATREIGQAISPLRADPGDEDDRSTNARPVFSGPRPRWIQASLEQHPDAVCREIFNLTRDCPTPINAGQIAIIVRDPYAEERFRSALSARSISSVIINKFTPLRLDGNDVHIVQAPSSKGLGFPVVFVPEVHEARYPWQFLMDRAKEPQQREQIEDSEQRLLYVALSRASHRLYMLVDSERPSPFVKKLDRAAHWS